MLGGEKAVHIRYACVSCVSDRKCGTGSTRRKCYFIRPAGCWFEARNTCAFEGADLAVLTADVYWRMRRKKWTREWQYRLDPDIEYYIGLANFRLIWNATGQGTFFKFMKQNCVGYRTFNVSQQNIH